MPLKTLPLSFESYTRHLIQHSDELSFMLAAEGERVVDAVPQILCREALLEKQLEHLSYEQGCVRLIQEYRDHHIFHPLVYAWMLGYERLYNYVPNPFLMYIRMVLSEIDRIFAHGRNLAELMGLLELPKAQDHVGSLLQRIKKHVRAFYPPAIYLCYPFFAPVDRLTFLKMVKHIHQNSMRMIDAIDSFLASPLVQDRMRQLGVLSQKNAIDFGLGGPVMRASGIEHDGRRYQHYDDYSSLVFDVGVRSYGDCYDRYKVRLDDLQQSSRILLQCLEKVKAMDEENDTLMSTANQPLYRRESPTTFVEGIHHVVRGGYTPATELYCSVEGPRGEAGIFWLSEGQTCPYRVHLRTPGHALLNVVPLLLKDRPVYDAPLILNSLDIHRHDVIR